MSFLKSIKNRDSVINQLSNISNEDYNQYNIISEDSEDLYDIFQLKMGMSMKDKKTKRELFFLTLSENNDLILVDKEKNEIVWYNRKDIEPA